MASRRHGLVTRQEVLADGIGSRSIDRHLRIGAWRRVVNGIYLLADRPVEWLDRARAAVLACGPRSALGGTSAAFLFGLVPQPTGLPQLWIPPDAHQRRNPGFTTRRDGKGRLTRALPISLAEPWVDVLRVTSLEDTVIDAAQASAGAEEVIAILASANRRMDFAPDRVLHRLGQHPRGRHHELVTGFLRDSQGVESVLEYYFWRDVVQAHAIPGCQRQVSVHHGARHDVVIEEFHVIIELDGASHHNNARARFRDMQRDNRSAARGYTTLRFGWHDVVARPCEVAAQIIRTLRERGWRGEAQACPKCSIHRPGA